MLADAQRTWIGGRAAGFTLIEAVFAIGFLSVLTLSLALGMGHALRYTAFGRSAAAATTLAQDQIEALTSRLDTDADLAAGMHVDPRNPLAADGTTGGIYIRSWEVADDAPSNGAKTIVVTVTWTLYGEGHTIRVGTVRL